MELESERKKREARMRARLGLQPQQEDGDLPAEVRRLYVPPPYTPINRPPPRVGPGSISNAGMPTVIYSSPTMTWATEGPST